MRDRYPDFKEDFFSAPNLENSYWAGFIAADGNVSTLKGSMDRLSIGLQASDAEHLEALRDAICAGEVNYHSPFDQRTQKRYHRATYAITSTQICADLLKNFNIGPRKSLTHEPPNLDGDLALAFIAGYIDGDGSYMAQHNRPHLSIAGTEAMLDWISKIFEIDHSIYAEGKVYVSHYRGDKAILARQSLHRFDLPFLKRKVRRWEDLGLNLNTLNTQE